MNDLDTARKEQAEYRLALEGLKTIKKNTDSSIKRLRQQGKIIWANALESENSITLAQIKRIEKKLTALNVKIRNLE